MYIPRFLKAKEYNLIRFPGIVKKSQA